ncbi:MAG: hypothetical protein HUU01_20545 [Saprospiraceae bacterium]|nr:hypothetical protein [Saprospiraceae bacterium]
MPDQQIVTVSFFRYQGIRRRWQAFTQMGRSRQLLQGIEGLQFAKMLGSGGGNGFSIRPNLGVYGLLGVWENESAARQFFSEHATAVQLKNQSTENWTVFMRTAKSHGSWDGISPFNITVAYDEAAVVGVLTRATIKPAQLWHFWKFVPPVSRSISGRAGLLFSVGIGELPLIQQATFSLWQNSHAMKAYAYESGFHKTVVRRTRETGWYSEELFARFHPFCEEGSWAGVNSQEAVKKTGSQT